MNLEELRSAQRTERQKDSLQALRPSFYQEVGEYIADLEAERDELAEHSDDPFASPEVTRLTDEIETAKDVVEAIYERRMGKLVKQASLAAAGMSADDEGLTAEERTLFDDLVERIRANKAEILDVLAARDRADVASTDRLDSTDRPDPNDRRAPTDRPDSTEPGGRADAGDRRTTSTAADSPDGDERSGTDGVSAADAMGGGPAAAANDGSPDRGRGSDPTDGPGGASDDPARAGADAAAGDARDDGERHPDRADEAPRIDRLTVQITEDVGSILGVDDREYTLASDDVVTLPAENATPLIERDAAEPLE